MEGELARASRHSKLLGKFEVVLCTCVDAVLFTRLPLALCKSSPFARLGGTLSPPLSVPSLPSWFGCRPRPVCVASGGTCACQGVLAPSEAGSAVDAAGSTERHCARWAWGQAGAGAGGGHSGRRWPWWQGRGDYAYKQLCLQSLSAGAYCPYRLSTLPADLNHDLLSYFVGMHGPHHSP